MIEPDFLTPDDIPVFLEVSPALPLVDIDLLILRGSLLDPIGAEGLTRLTGRLMRRGPRGVDTETFDARIDSLGATLSVSVGHETTRISGSVIKRNLEPYLREVARIVLEPGLREDDFERLRRTTEAELVQRRDSDSALAVRAFRELVFGRHRYGRSVAGRVESVRSLTLDAARKQHAKLVRAPHFVIGLAGDVTAEEAEALLARAFEGLPRRAIQRPAIREARRRAGRNVVLVDKPQRTQSQIYVGALGIRVGEPEGTPLTVANTAFGGTFTARLMHEVRSERGWSYGAYSKVGADRQREAWSMWTHPSAEQLVDCLRLQLELYERWIVEGLSRDEVRRAKRYLIKSHAFDRETASKRLEPKLQTVALDLPPDWFERYPKRVRAVTQKRANDAVRAVLSPADLSIAVLATATPELERALGDIEGVRSLRVVPYDSL